MNKFLFELFSTGPIENAIGTSELSVSKTVIVKVLNNGDCRTHVRIKLFALDGTKREVDCQPLSVSRRASAFVILDVAELFEFEIQIAIEKDHDVLVSVWGKDENGNLVAAQRLVHQELVEICDVTDY